MKIRIKFKKHGTMKFIGHLDVMRYFQKAIRRSGVDICYSGGFSPHQVMSFAAPLGVGITSNGEYVDIEVLGTEDSRSMVRRLNQVMSEGFEIVSYRELPDTAGNAMSIVAAADYRVAFRPGYEPEGMTQEEWFEGLVGFYGQPQVIVTKKTKRGQAELDIKPLVYELRAARWEEPGQEELSAQDPSQPEKTAGREEGRPALFMKISTGSSSNIKPIWARNGRISPFWCSGKRYMPTWLLMHRRKRAAMSLYHWNSWGRKYCNGQADCNKIK